MSGFAKTIPPERLAVFTNMNLPRCSYFFTNTDIKKTCAQLKFQYLLEKSKDDKLQAERRQGKKVCICEMIMLIVVNSQPQMP